MTDVEIIRGMLERAGLAYDEQAAEGDASTLVLVCDRKYFVSVFTFKSGKLASIDVSPPGGKQG